MSDGEGDDVDKMQKILHQMKHDRDVVLTAAEKEVMGKKSYERRRVLV